MRKKIVLFAIIITFVLGACSGETEYQEISGEENVNSSVEDDTSYPFTSSEDAFATTVHKTISSKKNGETATNIGTTTTYQKGENVIGADALLGETNTANSSSSATTTAQTTLQPAVTTQIKGVLLPQIGYDPDGKGVIQVGRASVSGQKLYLELKNVTQNRMTEETSYLEYTCYDTDGMELKKAKWAFGAIEAGKAIARELEFPKGTEEIRITAFKVVYWSQWRD